MMGISGGSGSGKSTIVNEIIERLGPEKIAVLHHDAYYRHRPELSFEERTKINFDHPDSLETKLLVKHLKQLISGNKVEVPIYDFAQHLRDSKTKNIAPCQILIVDGILVLSNSQLCEMMDLKVFVDVPSDLRFIRRLERDLSERGRSVESVTEQYLTTVRPMHEIFVEPSKQQANILIPGGGHNLKAVQLLIAHLQSIHC
ncbi:MAG: uridine kinase [SAR324 cluster bacterium]|nr:uridine kinase [SAR324 cluster bacterium]MBL7034681.1 uridine kinase [SAR324 cluster bacterium]